MDIVQFPDRLEFNNHGLLHQQVRGVYPNGYAIAPDSDLALLFDGQASFYASAFS